MTTPTSAQYANLEHTAIRVTLDDDRHLFVPVNEDNRHYRELQEYIAENPEFVVAEADPEPTVVPAVAKVALVRAMRQTRLNGGPITTPATQTSVWQETKSKVSNAPIDVKEDWELMAVVPRDDAIIQHLVNVLPWAGTQYTGDQIMDHIYELASEAP